MTCGKHKHTKLTVLTISQSTANNGQFSVTGLYVFFVNTKFLVFSVYAKIQIQYISQSNVKLLLFSAQSNKIQVK